ncbi:Pogo transposable element-like 82 [Homarus americanus]|uniref:Pogo transposable element-like 82 n=1 Tax=Homarus americanus TaxID=6706 RepID=A0A8J5JSJ0_HOMAM|nr:Pogo transposable element-like 82 [Homarus americanus]
MAPIVKRRRYEACFKLKVIAYAQSHNNCAASREYGVTEKMVRDWNSKEHLLRSMPRNKCAMRRGTAHWPILEKHAVDMVHEQRQNGYIVSSKHDTYLGTKWAKQNQEHSKDFKATASWCSRFMERSNLDETEAEATSSDLEFDLYDEAAINVSQDVLEELMISDVDDVDFEGF